MTITLLTLMAGLLLLILGAEMLVRGGSRLAAAAGVSPLVIGLTLVAFGTSAPEMAVSVKAALSGQADISLGNVVGSNIFNVLFILGISSLLAPLTVSRKLLWKEVPLMIGTAVLLWLMGLDGQISQLDGVGLVAGIFAYTWRIIAQAKQEKPLSVQETQHLHVDHPHKYRRLPQAGLCVLGLGVLVMGTHWFVGSAVTLAKTLGLSELVIGLTIVAAGTSMPEVFTSVIATLRGERDIAIGNVVGSNIFNILAVQGLSSALSSTGVSVADSALRFDIPVMTAVSIACLPIFFTGHSIARWEGALFMFYYAAYTVYLILNHQSHDALGSYSVAMWSFVIPLTVLTLGIVLYRDIRTRRREKTA